MAEMIHVNVFTNCNGENTIDRTVDSFRERFGDYPMTVYVDPAPRTGDYPGYLNYIMGRYPDVVKTDSLVDGYRRSLMGDAEYLFQLEHDWLFKSNIKHSLEQIVDIMNRDGLVHLRFNKRSNNPGRWDKWLKSKGEYCLTPAISNNPHLIDRRLYVQKLMPYLVDRKGNKGIEEAVSNRGIHGAIYGGMGYLATLEHIG